VAIGGGVVDKTRSAFHFLGSLLPVPVISLRIKRFAISRKLSCLTAAVVTVLSFSSAPLIAQVRISQVYSWGGADADGFAQDYVELHNAADAEVSFAGFLGFYGSDGTWLGGGAVNGAIPAKGFLLVGVGNAGVGRPLAAADGAITDGDLPQNQSFTVVVWQAIGADYDFSDCVGIGEVPYFFEGSGPAPAADGPSLSTRRSDVSLDGDDNAADFTVGPADPRNSLFGLPTLSSIAAQRINEGESTSALGFQVSAAGRDPRDLLVAAASSNSALVPNDGPSLALGGGAGERTITVTPAPGVSGKTVITITVSDGQYQTQASFPLTVNGRPSITNVADISTLAGTTLQPIAIQVGDAEMSGETVIRVMAANTTSGNSQSYEDPGDRIFRGLKPDVALVQEFNVSAARYSSIRAWVNANFGTEFHYYREPLPAGTSFSIPNGVVSRWPIVASGSWDDSLSAIKNREFAWAKIDIPGDKDLWVVSLHFYASGTPTDRNSEAAQLISYIQSNIPEKDYVLIGGDLNTQSTTEPCLSTLYTLFDVTAPWPSDEKGDIDTNAGRVKPLDWIFAEPELDALGSPLEIGPLTFPHGLVFDSRVFSRLDLVAPVQQQDSAATNMQHMAVLREFTLPAPASLSVTASSSNQALVRNEDLVIRGAGASRTIDVTPQLGASGVTTITVTVSDGEASKSEQFALTVEAKTFSSWLAATKVPADRRGMSDRNGPAELANLAAYAMGIDPIEASQADMPKVVAVVDGGGAYLSYSYKRAKFSPGVSVLLEGSSDLVTWLPAEVMSEQVSPHSDTREGVVAQIEVPAGKNYFVRLKAVSN
jgi:endonuclease/exonuclease/phosphatase family metal-dependent hydrolase